MGGRLSGKVALISGGARGQGASDGVLLLASDEASYVTGTDLTIDGGFLAQ